MLSDTYKTAAAAAGSPRNQARFYPPYYQQLAPRKAVDISRESSFSPSYSLDIRITSVVNVLRDFRAVVLDKNELGGEGTPTKQLSSKQPSTAGITMPLDTAEAAAGSQLAPSIHSTASEDSYLLQDEDADATPRAGAEMPIRLPETVSENGHIDLNGTNGDIGSKASITTEPIADDSKPPPESEPDQVPALSWLDKALAEISTASDKTLIIGLSLLAVIMSVLLGRFGLLIVGTILGAILHATLQNQSGTAEKKKPKFRSKGTDEEDAKPVVWTAPGDSKPQETKVAQAVPDDPHADFSSLNPKVASALDELCNAIVKDCINSWYTTIIPDDSSFPATCHQHLTQSFLRISKRLGDKRPAEIFVSIVANMSDTVIIFMEELSQALNGTRDIKAGIQTYVRRNRDSALSIMLNKGYQRRELGFCAQEIVQQYAPEDLKGCEPVAMFLRHVLRSTVLWNMVEKFSDPEFINEWIIYLFEYKESTGPSKEGVGAVLQAFDRSVAGAAQSSLPAVSTIATSDPEFAARSPTGSSIKEEVFAVAQALDETTTSDAQRMLPPVSTTMLQDSHFMTQSPTQSPIQSHSQSQSQSHSPTVRKENFPAFPVQTNGVNGIHHNSESVHYESIPNGKTSMDERRSLEILSDSRNQSRNQSRAQSQAQSQNHSPVDVQPHSPLGGSLKRNSSNASSRISLSEMSMTPYKTSSESSRSGIDPQVAAEQRRRAGVNLLNARVTVLDTGPAYNPPRVLKSKPKSPFMIQLEPLDAAGWIVMKGYQDFETLHETLIKLATPTGSTKYKLAYTEGLPSWRDRTVDELVALLELFLRIALSEEGLAGSETLFKFFQKDEDRREREKQERIENSVFWRSGAQIENMGKNVLGAITKAPQSASEGGKAFLGGIKKALTSQTPAQTPGAERDTIRSPFAFIKANISKSTLGGADDSTASEKSSMSLDRDDGSGAQTPAQGRGRFSLRIDFPRSFTIGDSAPAPPLPARRSASATRSRTSNYQSLNGAEDSHTGRPASLLEESAEGTGEPTLTFDSADAQLNGISLPPPPSEIDNLPASAPTAYEGISEQETQIVLEIMFSIINELYGLSTAWMIRRSFLNIAKSVMLLPGNSTLSNMRTMIQADVLEANTSAEAIADYVRQVRKNSLPTTTESEEWEKTHTPRTEEEKEELRRRARKVLSESLPQGLTALLGVNQTKEALSQLFDALQERDVARGLWTSLLAKAVQVLCAEGEGSVY
ncbi:hypothetical protein Dda_3809 [Drechslerella dactyloides]|uniref:PXA domain-containing protein n=1 Tax=Drechslerella dactyloides TaxID=74499 RepID=A0AAD6NLH2_DREDA|nr:hypothetical protein Dda_3809 [Drechslerella dactyloides]